MKIRFERLGNGLIQAFDYQSLTSGLYYSDGTYHSGDLRLTRAFVLSHI